MSKHYDRLLSSSLVKETKVIQILLEFCIFLAFRIVFKMLDTETLIEEQNHTGVHTEDEDVSSDMMVIHRHVYSLDSFDQGYESEVRAQVTPLSWLKSKVKKCECSLSCVGSTLCYHLPCIGIMRSYKVKKDLLPDVIAGLTVGIMHISQGMAYGQLANLTPVYGLYVSFFPVILYFFFGSSKHISIGTFAVMSLMVGSAVTRGLSNLNLMLTTRNETVNIGGGNITYHLVDNKADIDLAKVQIAMSVSFIAGIIHIILGLLHLGFITVYLSDPLIRGFTTATAFHVFTSQIKSALGISTGTYSGAFNLAYTYGDIFKNLPQTKPVTLIATVVCMFFLVVIKSYINGNLKIKSKLPVPLPAELLAVVLGTIISHFAKLEEKYGVKSIGEIPIGLPAPNLKAFSYTSQSIVDGIAIAIVSFAISVSMAKMFAKKHQYPIDSNQELLAYGLCNVICSFLSSFVSSASLSRCLVQEDVGGRTQVTGLVSSCLLLVVLLAIGPYFKTLPNCILAAIILVSLKEMFRQIGDLKVLYRISFLDLATWVITFLATVILDVDFGLYVGILFNLLTVIMRSQRPYSCLLGQVPGTDIYKDISVYRAAEEVTHVKIFRFDSALFFANSEYFKNSLYKLTVNPGHLKKLDKKLQKRKKKEEMQRINIVVYSISSADGSTREASTANARINDITHNSSHVAPDNFVSTEAAHPVPLQSQTLTDIKYIIIDCSTMSYVDSMGVKVLQQIISELKVFNITVFLAQCKYSVREMFSRTDFYKTESKNFLFVTIHDAVVKAQLHQRVVSRGQGAGHVTSATASDETQETSNALDVNRRTNMPLQDNPNISAVDITYI